MSISVFGSPPCSSTKVLADVLIALVSCVTHKRVYNVRATSCVLKSQRLLSKSDFRILSPRLGHEKMENGINYCNVPSASSFCGF